MRICVEGWAGLLNSYTLIAHRLAARLAARPDIDLRYRVRPLPPGWDGIPRREDMGPPAPAPEDGWDPDLILRVTAPIDLTPAGDVPVLVYATADYFKLESRMLAGQDLATLAPTVHVLTPSAFSRDGLIASGAPAERVHVVANGLNSRLMTPPDPAHRAAERQARGWQDRVVLLNVSALTIAKGPDLLIRAFGRVGRIRPRALLVLKSSDHVYGSGSAVASLIEDPRMAEHRTVLRNQLVYLGDDLPEPVLAGLYGAADLYVCPYRAEGFNMPALEAAACGLPVVATAGGPTDEFLPGFCPRIQSRITNTSWEGRDPDSRCLRPDLDHLAVSLCDAIDRVEVLRDQALATAPDLGRRYDWGRIANDLVTLIAGLIPSRS